MSTCYTAYCFYLRGTYPVYLGIMPSFWYRRRMYCWERTWEGGLRKQKQECNERFGFNPQAFSALVQEK